MKQEHKFCAEVYHRLYDLIDHSKRNLFCLDGAAAKEGMKKGEIECGVVPDFCFTFLGGMKEIRIEAKILNKRRIKLTLNERKLWCKSGKGNLSPHLWIGVNEQFDQFCVWEHSDFADKIENHKDSKGPILVSHYIPTSYDEMIKMIKMINRIVEWAEEKGFKQKDLKDLA